jgi:hypothetical protein
MRRAAAAVFLALASVLASGGRPAEAQYFGRNKVRYETFDFQVLRTEHFDIHFYPAEEPAARIVARLAERWYERLSVLLDHQLEGRQPIILYAGHPDFEQTNAIHGELGEATGGVTEVLKRRVVLPAAGPLPETDHVLGHELVHAFQFDVLGRGHRTALGLPLWFIEGMAEYLSLGPVDAHTAMWMRDAARTGRLPRVSDLGHPRYFPYRYGHAFWAYVAGRWGDDAVGRVLKAMARSRKATLRVIEKTLELSEEKLSREWQQDLRDVYAPEGRTDVAPKTLGRVLVSGKSAGVLNLSPSLSPDGRRMVFLSERKEGSLELFLADAGSGRVERRILRQRLDPHFDSLEFVLSAGAWDPSGRRFVFAGVRRGRPVLSILDVDRAEIAREVPLPQLEQVLNPTWSPDGAKIAFSAIRGGLTDLFVYDLAAASLDDLTDDAFADLHPAWSPDGSSIAFVTDRFSTRLEELAWGDYRLARIAMPSGVVEPLPSFPGAKNVNPQWGSGGRALYFLSDRTGGTEVYRLDVGAGATRQVTDGAGGISGLTPLSPALASATGAERLVVSVYRRGRYHLHAIEEPAVLAGRDVPGDDEVRHARLPPLERTAATVSSLLDDTGRGLPETSAFEAEAYRPRLTFDRVAEPYLAVGLDRFGTFVNGGASLFWSDMLGNHNLVTALEVKGSFKDLAGLVGYQNRKGRWIWTVAAEQLAFRRGAASSGLTDVEGRTARVEQTAQFRETDRRLTGIVAYPFHRSERVELSLGYRRASFSNEVETRAFSLETGERLSESATRLPAPSPLHLTEVGAALVHDSARFGPTSPVRGRRHRLEITPTFGTRSFTGVLADLRRYEMPVRPLTVAGRVIHYGRYGRDAEHRGLAPLFLGYPNLVRGYDVGAYGGGRCVPGGCPRVDELVGSKLLVANLELRAPALFFLGDERPYGPVPLEAALFFDAGVAWEAGERPSFLGGSRHSVKSWGAALRVNLFGLVIAEVDYVRPLDLPGTSSLWRLRFTPGF